ncbi:hypothetical protein L873DRAFT_1815384 [Choiromyces venosus 120613-1]|uniref:Tc1-like transposase DDE domain-containing protein n=1 Tax=Choiromyces venosus 120613-1 TaxID=1336337 RepID=A0A3N4JBN6_9PEZI|nr:hypothetical protein L873DRAFT_1815384 [Choiromyces venosus 120613-1]
MPRNTRSTGKHPKSTLTKRVQVIELQARGKSFNQIGYEVGIRPSQAYQIYQRWKAFRNINPPSTRHHHHHHHHHSGQALLRLRDRHKKSRTRISKYRSRELSTSKLDMRPSIRARFLQRMERRAYLARREPRRAPVNQMERKKWCEKRLKWTATRWRSHCYTDETYLQIVSDRTYGGKLPRLRGPYTLYNFKKKTPQQSPTPTDPRSKNSNNFAVRLWAGFTHGYHTPLVPIRRSSEGDLTAYTSTEYVNEIMIPYIFPLYAVACEADLNSEIVETGETYHTAHYTRHFRKEFGMLRMPWPADSPDFNPMEDIWRMFRAELRRAIVKRKKEFMQKRKKGSGVPRNEQDLIELAQDVWEGMPWGRVYKFVDRMPARVEDCWKRDGGMTRH